MKTVHYIDLDEILKISDFTLLKEDFTEVCDVSFGDASATLITKEKLLEIFENNMGLMFGEHLKKILNEISKQEGVEDFYINLE